MRYSKLGKSGLIVSRLSLGTMTFGEPAGGGSSPVYKVDQRGADALVGQALDAGVNFFNSADLYAGGQSETLLGKALGARRADAVIATKAGNRFDRGLLNAGLSRRHLVASVEGSLKRLGTDWIDVFLAHRFDPHTPLEETLAAFDDLVRAGKVRYCGFSNWPAWAAAKAVTMQAERGLAPFIAAEMYYSLVGRDLEHELLPLAADAGIGPMIWSPLAGGFLSGKYTRADPAGGGGRLTGFDLIPFDRERGYDLVDVIGQIATAHGATPAQVALAWLLSRPVASVIIGASNAQQLDGNLRAIDLTLSTDELDCLEALTKPELPYPNWFYDRVVDRVTEKALG